MSMIGQYGGVGGGSLSDADPSCVHEMTCREAALWYLEVGGGLLLPIPWVVERGVGGGGRARKKVALSGFTYATYTVTADDIHAWDTTWNVGLVVSASVGLFCLDVDNLATLAQWEETWGLSTTWWQETGRDGGGRHYLYRWGSHDGSFPRQGECAGYSGLEIKSNGFVGVAPSVHPSGRRYQWGEGLGGCGIAPAGGLLASYLHEREETRTRTRSRSVEGAGGNGDGGGQGGRPDIEMLLRSGIVAGGHDNILRDVVWYGVLDGKGDEELWLLWSAIVHRTAGIDPSWPFERGDFERHLHGAREVLGFGSGIMTEPWMVGAAKALAGGGGAGEHEALPHLDQVGGAVAAVGAQVEPLRRHVHVTWADQIDMKPVQWLWEGHIAIGMIGLLSGSIGIGKSVLMYTLAAAVTQGQLAGSCYGEKRRVMICATEDSWQHVIKPRLVAAGADVALIGRVDVRVPLTKEELDLLPPGEEKKEEKKYSSRGLTLPKDVYGLAEEISTHRVPLLLLDPLMSRLDARLNTHKDAEVRLALEPLAKMADETGCAVWGMIHTNKSGSADAMDLIMGSRAFGAVARTISYVVKDRDEESVRIFGTPKNNLGRNDLPPLRYHIDDAVVGQREGQDIHAGRLVWEGEDDRSMVELISAAVAGGPGRPPERRTSAAEWLRGFLVMRTLDPSAGGAWVPAGDVIEMGETAGHARATLQRAFIEIEGVRLARGFPRQVWWAAPGTDPATFPGEPSS